MSERTKKIEAIFHAASERSTPEERESYLNEACLGDERLRKEVDALLKAALAGEELFLGCEQSRVSTGIPVETLAEQPGTVIGRYKLLEKIGEGGMGVVYMAEQEQPVRRKVALKIIKLGMDTRQVVARFEAERQALAMMDHPNIAQVLDAGATETGRPYFVMELVPGVPITKFCETNDLSVEQRLKLFVPVCEAIQSAHQKGIIHRDIKPSNVLVTLHNGAPHPMVIDFGVAKAIDQKLTEKTLFTNFATMIGTPAYMSPEQAEMSKLDVDTRSDIYSLGVLLYELLTGTAPFPEERLRSVAYGEMQRIIAEEEPERPSTRLKRKSGSAGPIQAQIVNRQSKIDNDLDWIVMKCLEKNRDRRYETANGLVSDIQAHLSDAPVIARPPTAAYRFQKFVRRNKLRLATAATIALVLIAATVVSTRQAVRATRAEGFAKAEAARSLQAEQTAREEAGRAVNAEHKATEEAARAKAIKEFLLENLLGLNYWGDSIEPDAASYEATQALVYKVARRMEGRFTNQPQIEAEIRQALMTGFVTTRDYRSMAAQAERLAEINQHLYGPYHTNTVRALMSLGTAKYHSGQREEGMRLLTNTLEAVRAFPLAENNGALEAAESAYTTLLIEEGRGGEVLPYLREALNRARKIDPKSTLSRERTGALAETLFQTGHLAESETLWRETLESYLEDPNLRPMHPRTLDKQFGLGRVLLQQGRVDEATSVLSSVAVSYQIRLGSNYSKTLRAQGWLAMALDRKGETSAVARLYTDMHPRLMKFVPDVLAGYTFEDMAEFFVRQGNYAQAKAAYEPLRTTFETFSPRNGGELLTFVQSTAATKGWEAAVNVYRQYNDRFAESTSQSRARAIAFLYSGDHDGYQPVLSKVLASASVTNTRQEQQDILNIALLGSTAFSPEQVTRCEELIQSFERSFESATERQQDSAHRALGGMLLRLGRLTNSLEHLEIAEKKYPSGSQRARVLFLKSMCLSRLGRHHAARASFDEAEAITKSDLLKHLNVVEGYLTVDERTCLILRREAQTLLGVK